MVKKMQTSPLILCRRWAQLPPLDGSHSAPHVLQTPFGPVGSPDEGLSFWPNSRDLKEGGPIVQVVVRDNNVDQALRALKKKMQREGIFREMKLRRSYEKPSEKRAREKAEAIRRARKLARKRMEREGF